MKSRGILTAAAAEAAGFGKVVLAGRATGRILRLDSASRHQLAEPGQEGGDIVLVCDVGGGTADFSLIAVTEREWQSRRGTYQRR